MGILNTLSEIAKNKDKFKNYEQNQRDNDLQRDELNRRREHKQQEIKAAQDLGKTIIDVVDIMDQHSEDIAENVETITEPIIGLAPSVTGLLGFAGAYKTFIKPAIDMERDLVDSFRKDKEVQELVDKINEADKKINYQEKWQISSWALRDKKSISKIKKRHPDLGQKAENLYKKYNKEVQKQYKKIKIGASIPIISAIIGFVAANIYATKLQVESSRVARWQARKVLEDPKYFVNYTPEQVDEAKKNLENNPEYKKKDKKLRMDKLKNGLFKGLVSVIKDNRAYRKWKKTDVDESKKVDRQLTQEELKKAKKDKEIIQRVIRTVNNQAEVYSQNMEVAANVIMGTTPFLGAAVGAVVSSIMNWTKVIPDFINKQVQTYGTDAAKSAYNDLKGLKEGTREYKTAKIKFLKEWYSEPYISSAKNEAKAPTRMQIIEKNIRKNIATALTTKWGRRGVFGLIGGFVTSIAGSLIALKFQKAASRTGRYIAKRELEENPKNFIGYTDEEMQEVKDLKAPKKSFGEKTKEYVFFIPNVMKNYFAYQKYKKTELKQNKLLQEELVKLDVTENQMKEAKNLQRKLFNTFEKVDDKSQEYSESMEAAVEIAQPFVYGAGMFMIVSPLIYAGYLAAKGKLSAKSVINKVLTTLSGTSKITEKKWFKTYLENIAKQLPDKVAGTTVNSQVLGKVFKGINLEKTPVVEIISKFTKNSSEYIKNFSNLSTAEQRTVLEDIVNMLPENIELAKRFQSLKYASDDVFKAVINAIFKPSELGKSIQKMDEYDYMRFSSEISDLLGGVRNKLDYKKKNITFVDALFSMPRQELGKFLESLLGKDSIKKLVSMTNEEFAMNKKNVIEPLLEACDAKISKISESDDAFLPYLTLKHILRGLNAFPKENVSLIDRIVTQKKDFIKNLSDADFERLKVYVRRMNIVPDDVLEGLNKEFFQKYAQEISSVAQKVKNSPKIDEETVLSFIRKFMAEFTGNESLLAISKDDIYKFLDEEFIPRVAKNLDPAKKSQIINSQVKKLHEIFSNPQNPIPNPKNIKIGDILPEINPVKEIEKLVEKINAKSDENFTKFMLRLENSSRLFRRLNVSDMNKAYVLDALEKLKKVIERLPKEEMKKIMSAMITELSEHPDQFVIYVQSGKILNFFKTDGFKKAVVAAGVSWTAINFALTYAIESVLADLKLKAGRLGVMKALDSLDDPAYYGNIEQETAPAPASKPQIAEMPKNLLDMLKNSAV